MFTLTLKGLLARKVRLFLTAISVMLGVAFVSGTLVLTDTVNAAFDQLYAGLTKGTDVTVRAKSAFTDTSTLGSPKPFDTKVVDQVRKVDGVAAAEGSLTGYALMLDKSGKPIQPGGAPTLGAGYQIDRKLAGGFTLRQGRGPQTPTEVVIDAATAKKQGFVPGDTIKVMFATGGQRPFTVVGIAGFGEADNLAGATLATFQMSTAQQLLGRVGQFDTIDVRGESGVKPDELRARIARVLPADMEAVTSTTVASEASKSVGEALKIFTAIFLGFAAVSLLVGSFIIWNTFSILVTQRSREHALLRAIGAGRRQILGSVLVEAVVVGLVASGLGLGVGLLVASGLRGLLSVIGMELPNTTLQLHARTVVAAVAVGVGITLVAALAPAWKATRIPPIAALRDAATPAKGVSRWRLVLGGLLFVGGVAGLVRAMSVDAQVAAAGVGALATFFGLTMLAPVVVRPLVRVLGAPIAGSVTGGMGRLNAARSPRRTASTATALVIGLALVVGITVVASSIKASVGDVVDRANKADLILKSASQFAPGFPSGVADKLRKLPEVGAVSQLRFGAAQIGGMTDYIAGVDPATVDRMANLGVASGSVAALGHDGVLVNTDVAKAKGLRVGSPFTVKFAQTGDQKLRVAGTFTDKTLVGSSYLISLDTYNANFSERLDIAVLVGARKGVTTEQVKQAAKVALTEYPNVSVQDSAELKKTQNDSVNQLLGMVYVMLLLAVVIALLGVVNTLALSVLERTRELGLLRAVGMTRRQVRSAVRWEAVLIAAVGAVLGLCLGLAFGAAFSRALADIGIVTVAVPIVQPVVCAIIAALAGVVAAILPARRAAKVDILRAVVAE
ncbi:ABC transporter permease [Planosporangium flavigriseum]|uniref:ABC transporter substrate-binding protein n=1 Tax=Planosporangium flavigriseum TaxID=373681 RepID=A0A8J3PQ41_9ACTN|nr:ABC transporter permease [Planosporangium flavigriseum]NJC67616.1 ABC transporter permease [Planosporangium flavigriseum]GIG75686.1 ABC transporter substrate-binding protein [Planosporangium flavigriseum]